MTSRLRVGFERAAEIRLGNVVAGFADSDRSAAKLDDRTQSEAGLPADD
jgi:hypothetical protein